MSLTHNKQRILFFIGSLCGGGKERRLVELLTYLKGKDRFEILVVVTKDEVQYPDFYKLNIPYRVLPKKWESNDPTVFYQFYKICRQFRPHLIHSWGRMQSFYALPAVIRFKIPLVNSQITSAPPRASHKPVDLLLDQVIFRYSRIILANSRAGITSFNPPAGKSKVIYNGLNMKRFADLPPAAAIKQKYGIKTPYTVIMAASISANKNYDLFYRIAQEVTRQRPDITFIGVGGCRPGNPEHQRLLRLSADNDRILFPGRINDVEALVNACDIGVLFSPNGEGISNAIMEYMALGKPVIANDAGGNKEIVQHNQNGYLLPDPTPEQVAPLIMDLIEDKQKYQAFSSTSRKVIEDLFSLDKMGLAFEQVYKTILQPAPRGASALSPEAAAYHPLPETITK